MKLTENFNLSEFECKCGCSMPDFVKKNVIELAENLQVLRDVVGKLDLTNAYRCKEHNDSIKGSSKNSQHILGKAADIQCSDINPKTIADLVEDLISKNCIKEGGVGRYNTFTHYDIRGTKARWNNLLKK